MNIHKTLIYFTSNVKVLSGEVKTEQKRYETLKYKTYFN